MAFCFEKRFSPGVGAMVPDDEAMIRKSSFTGLHPAGKFFHVLRIFKNRNRNLSQMRMLAFETFLDFITPENKLLLVFLGIQDGIYGMGMQNHACRRKKPVQYAMDECFSRRFGLFVSFCRNAMLINNDEVMCAESRFINS